MANACASVQLLCVQTVTNKWMSTFSTLWILELHKYTISGKVTCQTLQASFVLFICLFVCFFVCLFISRVMSAGWEAYSNLIFFRQVFGKRDVLTHSCPRTTENLDSWVPIKYISSITSDWGPSSRCSLSSLSNSETSACRLVLHRQGDHSMKLNAVRLGHMSRAAQHVQTPFTSS